MKTMEKFEIGKNVAKQSDGRIELSVENSVAYLRGEFTRKDRQAIKYRNGGWKFHRDESGEFWTLSVGRIKKSLGKLAETEHDDAAEEHEVKSNGVLYVRWNDGHPELFHVTRATKASVWLVGADGKEFRKAIGENAEKLSGEFCLVK